MNNVSKTIGWADKSWNPVVGCKHNCSYCYAKRMNDRFKWIEKWNKPKFYVNRLHEPYMLKKPNKIFTCSMSDLFGDWIPDMWIKKIIKVAKDNPQHTFQFLTKNPKRYLEFEFPENCWLGMTLTYGYPNDARLRYLKKKDNYKFVSVEPLLGDMSMVDFSKIDLVIVGAQTGPRAVKPKEQWIASIKHKNIFYKKNIQRYL